MNKKLKWLLDNWYFSDGGALRSKERAKVRAQKIRGPVYNAQVFESKGYGKPSEYFVMMRPRCLSRAYLSKLSAKLKATTAAASC